MNQQEREVIKQAFEALEYWAVRDEFNSDTREAIAALRQLLEQPEPVQEPVAWVEYETGNHTKRPQNCGTGYCSCIECPFKKGGA
jgi:hypothetical protein